MSARRGFLIDLNKCTGCHACEMACQIANDVPGERRWRQVRTFNELHVHDVEVAHLSLACNHCANPPCLKACPSGAYYRDVKTCAVLLNQNKCIGCRYCSWACPYGAPRFDKERGVMDKCHFCAERQHAGGRPACVTCCPTGALKWGDLPEPARAREARSTGLSSGATGTASVMAESITVPGMAETDADPSIHIIPLKAGRLAPSQTEPPALPPWSALDRGIVPQITIAHDWTLILFTLLISALVGLFLGSRVGAQPPNAGLFLGAGLAGLFLSALHLGRRARAWRAGNNTKRSWLSREIVLFCAFLLTASLALYAPDLHRGSRLAPAYDFLDWLAAAIGLGALFATDRVYRVATIRGGSALHSAHPLWTGLMLAAAFSGATVPLLLLLALKALLYGNRKLRRARLALPSRRTATIFRLGLLASGAVSALSSQPGGLFLSLLVAGELIDRAEYYEELQIRTPEALLLEELGSRPQAHGSSSAGRRRGPSPLGATQHLESR